jgi:hypothetical protein
MPVLETVRNISFLSTILELYSEITLSRKRFGIGHIYIQNFLIRMTDTMTSQDTDLSSWDTLYFIISFILIYNHTFFFNLRSEGWNQGPLDTAAI